MLKSRYRQTIRGKHTQKKKELISETLMCSSFWNPFGYKKFRCGFIKITTHSFHDFPNFYATIFSIVLEANWNSVTLGKMV